MESGQVDCVLLEEYSFQGNLKELGDRLAEKKIFLILFRENTRQEPYFSFQDGSEDTGSGLGLNKFLLAINDAYKKLLIRDSRRVHPSARPQKFIFVRTNHKLVKVNLSEICFLEGLKDYTKIYTQEDKFLLTLRSLKAFELLLPVGFIRVHRSYIVSLDKIESVIRNRILVGKFTIPISDSLKDQFYELLQIYS